VGLLTRQPHVAKGGKMKRTQMAKTEPKNQFKKEVKELIRATTIDKPKGVNQ